MADTRLNDLREWLDRVSKKTGMKLTPLANHIGVSPSTLTRIPKPDYKGLPSVDTIAKLAEASGIPAPSSLMGGPEHAGLEEREVVAYREGPSKHPFLRELSNSQDIWTVHTEMLDLLGLLPGDQIMLDLNAAPRSGDIVMAQVYGDGGIAETILRKYDAPFLVVSTTNRNAPKPIYVDHERTVIMGVVRTSWRDYTQAKKSA